MSTQQRGRGSKYTDDFKRQLIAESSVDGVSVPMVAQRHGVPGNRIYAWRSDGRFQPDATEVAAFMPVEISGDNEGAAPVQPESKPTSAAQIEITLENGRKLSISDGVDAGFVLEVARGLAA